jgi:hypothetical protein
MTEKQFLCPNCGKPMESMKECNECGWEPGLTKEEVQEAVLGYLEEMITDGYPIEELTTIKIATDLQLGDIPNHLIARIRKKFKDQMAWQAKKQQLPPPVQQQQQQQMFGPQAPMIPDWILAPYKMQIENLKEDRDRQVAGLKDDRDRQVQVLREERDNLRVRVTTLEHELREEMKRPQQTDPKWQELDKLAFERLKSDITSGRNANAPPKSWMEELVSGLVSSGQLGNIAAEGASLLSDLRNRGNPDHDPYAQFYAQKAAQEQAVRRQPQRRNPVPPANIKRVAKRPSPPAVKSQAQAQPPQRPMYPASQPQPQPPAEQPPEQQVELIDGRNDIQEQQPDYDQPEYVQVELSEENMEIYGQFAEKYPDLADTVPMILIAIDEEAPGTSRADKIRGIIETLRVVAQLREIGVGVKGILNGTFSAEQAATFLIQRYPEQARILGEQGADSWLERGDKLFAEHPIHGKDIRFLQEPEARQAINAIVAVIKTRYGIR